MISADIDATADELARLLAVNPEKIMVLRGENQIVLSHSLARRLLTMLPKAEQSA